MKQWEYRKLWKIAGRRGKITLTISGWRTWYSSSGPMVWVWGGAVERGRGLPVACWGSVHSLLVFRCLGGGSHWHLSLFTVILRGRLKRAPAALHRLAGGLTRCAVLLPQTWVRIWLGWGQRPLTLGSHLAHIWARAEAVQIGFRFGSAGGKGRSHWVHIWFTFGPRGAEAVQSGFRFGSAGGKGGSHWVHMLFTFGPGGQRRF